MRRLKYRLDLFATAFLSIGLATMLTSSPAVAQDTHQRVSLLHTTILVDPSEPSYVQYGANDLGSYLGHFANAQVSVKTTPVGVRQGENIIAIGSKMSRAVSQAVPEDQLSPHGIVIRVASSAKGRVFTIAGSDPHATNEAIASFLQMIHAEGGTPFYVGPAQVRAQPSFAVRGFHLNGWPLKYPYAFRSWKEADWKRFIDIAWSQRVNLFYLWPFMEVMPVPLSKEDESYLQEVRRVVEYAEKQRGMQVWIMQSANRIAVSDCGSPDPRTRTYWVMGECQKDMNPADPEDFAKITKSFQALYQIVNNADGFCLIDSDPGGWPHSPLSDQTKIFNAARKLLDQYSLLGTKTKLIDWMWIGWGRVFDPTEKNTEEDGVAFMQRTIENFKNNLPEPWELIAGMAPYLKSAQRESVLDKTTYLQYGAIEMEPAFPSTNLGQDSIREVFRTAAEYPGLNGIMGNNELMLLQLPRTYYFFNTAWNKDYANVAEPDVLLSLSEEIYPDHRDLLAESFRALRESDPEKIAPLLTKLQDLVRRGDAGNLGPIGRFLFPDALVVARILQSQLEIRYARQEFLKALSGTPNVEQASKLLENYFAKLLAWNQETGWDKMINITIWRAPIYEDGKDLSQAIAQLRKVLAQGKPYTSYAQVDDFFSHIAQDLSQQYGRDSVMVGCVEPFKNAVLQSW